MFILRDSKSTVLISTEKLACGQHGLLFTARAIIHRNSVRPTACDYIFKSNKKKESERAGNENDGDVSGRRAGGGGSGSGGGGGRSVYRA